LSRDNTTHYSHVAYMSAEWSVSLSISDFMLTNTKAYDTPEGFLAKVTCASKFCKKTCASYYLRQCHVTHLKVEAEKLQVKCLVWCSCVASWCCILNVDLTSQRQQHLL